MALREILATLGVEVDDKQLDKTDAKLDGFIKKAKQVGELLLTGAAAKGLFNFIDAQIQIGSRLEDVSNKLGVASDDLQRFEYAAEIAGSSVEGMDAALGFLNKNMGKALDGNAASVETFAKLGVALKDAEGARPLADVFLDLGDALAGLGSQQERTAVSMELFGRGGAAILPLLKDGSKGVAELLAEADKLGIVMGGDFIAAADEAGDNLARFKAVSQGLKSQFALGLLPAFTAIITKVTAFAAWAVRMAKSTTVVQSSLVALGTVGVFHLARIIKTINMLAAGKFLLIAGIAAAIYLVFDDLFSLMTGGESVIGDVLDRLFGVGAATAFAEQLRDTWREVSEAFSSALPALGTIMEYLGPVAKTAISWLLVAFVGLVKVLAAAVTLWGGLVNAVKEMAAAFADVRSKGGGVFEALMSKAGSLGSLMAPNGKAGKAIDKAGDKVFGSGSDPGILSFAPKPKADFNMTAPANLSQQNHVEIQINGATNPVETGRKVAGFVGEQIDLQGALAAAGQ